MHTRSPSSPVGSAFGRSYDSRPPSSSHLLGGQQQQQQLPGISTSSLGRRVKSLAGNGQSGPLTSLLGPNVGAWLRKAARKPVVLLSSLLSSLVLLFLLSNSSSFRPPPPPSAILHSASGPYVPSPGHPASPGGDDPEGGKLCHPYHAFGALNADPDIPELNRYHPFAEGCEAPQLMRGLRIANGVSDSEAYVKHAAKDKGKSWLLGNGGRPKAEDMSWLRGRTALLIGDSTARNQLEQFCAFIGEQFTIHPPADEALPTKRASKDAAYTHACYARKLDFLLVSVFHFGVDTESFWKDKDSFNPPSTFEDRLAELFVPLATDGGLESMLPERPAPDTPSRSIDLVELSTGLWDLARFAKLDIDADRSTITDLPRADLLWYSSRVADMVGATIAAFPDAKVVWRSMHWPSDKDAKVDWFMGWNYGDEKKHRPFFHHNRILQLEQAARAAISPDSSGGGFPSVEISEWGSMLLGQHVHQMDQLHPGPLPAGYLGGDILLYELRDAVLSRRGQ